MQIFSILVLILNLMALIVNIMAGNILNALLCILVTGVVGYYIWSDWRKWK